MGTALWAAQAFLGTPAGPCHPGAHYCHFLACVPGSSEVSLDPSLTRRTWKLDPGTCEGRRRWGADSVRARVGQGVGAQGETAKAAGGS